MGKLWDILRVIFPGAALTLDKSLGTTIKPTVFQDFLKLGLPPEDASPADVKAFTDKILKSETDMQKGWMGEGEGTFGIDGSIAAFVLPMMMATMYPLLFNFMQGTLIYLQNRYVHGYRLDPDAVIRLWLRGFPSPEEAEKWFSDLEDQGWSSEKIGALKELAHYLPSPTEVMTWAAREVFEPELRKKFELDKFLPPEFLEWAAKVGITGEVAKNYWAAHWVLPSLSNVIELWRRQIWDKETVDAFWTELDMVPWVREDLFKLFRAVPTRVDVRRWWDMRTIEEPRLRQIYQSMGYWEEDLEDYVVWTKVYTEFPDLIARYKNNYITEDDVYSRLVKLGMPADRAKELLETKIKNVVAEERVADTTKLTRSLIIKGAKEGKLSKTETIELLTRKNYAQWEAEYIYDVEVEGTLSPETPMEFKKLVESYRKSQGLDYIEIPAEVLVAERTLSELALKRSQAITDKEPQSVIDELQADIEVAKVKLSELKVLHRL